MQAIAGCCFCKFKPVVFVVLPYYNNIQGPLQTEILLYRSCLGAPSRPVCTCLNRNLGFL